MKEVISIEVKAFDLLITYIVFMQSPDSVGVLRKEMSTRISWCKREKGRQFKVHVTESIFNDIYFYFIQLRGCDNKQFCNNYIITLSPSKIINQPHLSFFDSVWIFDFASVYPHHFLLMLLMCGRQSDRMMSLWLHVLLRLQLWAIK